MKTVRNCMCLIFAAALLLAFTACGAAPGAAPEDDPFREAPTAPMQSAFPVRQFGQYEWLELAHADGKTLLLTKDIIETAAFHNTEEPAVWAACDLRVYLNSTFFERTFSPQEREQIALTKLDNSGIDDFGNGSGVPGGPATEDHVFLLSYEEAQQYFSDDLQRRAAKAGDPERFGFNWWLRSPGDFDNGFANVSGIGQVQYSDASDSIKQSLGLRPAIWVFDAE